MHYGFRIKLKKCVTCLSQNEKDRYKLRRFRMRKHLHITIWFRFGEGLSLAKFFATLKCLIEIYPKPIETNDPSITALV